MSGFGLNIAAALIWALFAGELSLRELAVGYLVGFLVLLAFPRALGSGRYTRRTLRTLGFLLFFLRELSVANVQVALYALRPHPPLHPLIVAVPLRLTGEGPLTLLTAAVNLMPGTVVMGLSGDGHTLYAHTIGVGAEQAQRSIHDLETRLIGVLGRERTRRAGPRHAPVEDRR